MTIERIRRLWYLSTVQTHSKGSLEELHELVKEITAACLDAEGIICGNCVHKIPCEKEKCPKYESGTGAMDAKTGRVFPDFKWTCLDFDWGDCPMLENSPCATCDVFCKPKNFELMMEN